MIHHTSDLHLFHEFVAKERCYNSVEDHANDIGETWTAHVRPDDTVYVHGDVTTAKVAAAMDFIADLPGRKILIAGNHDKCHPMYRDAQKWHKVYSRAFEYIVPFARRRIDGTSVLLSHFPYTADRGEPRAMQYRLPDLGEWLLHGHLHSTERITSSREIHVGWDAWHRPVTEVEIADLMTSMS